MTDFSETFGELLVRSISLSEIDKVINLQKNVYSAMPVKSQFVITADDEIYETISRDLCIGVFKDGTLAAVTTMIKNRPCDRNVGGMLGYDPLKCVTYDTTFIHPDFRGRGIQRKLIPVKDTFAIDCGAEFAFATVSPENSFSLNNVLSSGFEIVDNRVMYGGFQRYILRKKLFLPGKEDKCRQDY